MGRLKKQLDLVLSVGLVSWVFSTSDAILGLWFSSFKVVILYCSSVALDWEVTDGRDSFMFCSLKIFKSTNLIDFSSIETLGKFLKYPSFKLGSLGVGPFKKLT